MAIKNIVRNVVMKEAREVKRPQRAGGLGANNQPRVVAPAIRNPFNRQPSSH